MDLIVFQNLMECLLLEYGTQNSRLILQIDLVKTTIL